MLKMWPYAGKPAQPDLAPPDTKIDTVPELVKFMVREAVGTGRNVTMDRFFTFVPLVEELLSDRVTVVGTINRNRRLLPKELTEARGRDPESTLFAFRGGVTLASHCPRPGKLVLALSSQHQAPMVDSQTKKPEIILAYNATKGGVDVLDAMIASYMGKPALRRWPTAVFFFLLGVAEVNASTLLLLNRGQGAAEVKSSARRKIIFAMGQQLASPRLSERVTRPTGLNHPTLAALACVGGGGLNAGAGASTASAPTLASKGRCVECLKELTGRPDYKLKKSQLTKKPPCSKCAKYVCERHSVALRVCKACESREWGRARWKRKDSHHVWSMWHTPVWRLWACFAPLSMKPIGIRLLLFAIITPLWQLLGCQNR